MMSGRPQTQTNKMALNRRFRTGAGVRQALSIEELRAIAHRRIPNFALEYVEGGADDEATLRWNRSALDAIRLVPNTLVDTGSRRQDGELFGREFKSPLIIAPTGLNGMLRFRGDVLLARAAAAASVPFTLSTVSNVRLEEVAQEAGGRLWMQLYVFKDRSIAQDIVSRADRAGFEALVFTSDANVFGNREWDRRNYRAPAKLTWRNVVDVALHPSWAFDVMVPNGAPLVANIADYLTREQQTAKAGVATIPKMFASDISWDDVVWLRKAWPRKLIVKGILNVADAVRAAELGCDGIVVTNHGGRQLDSCVAPIEVLPEIVSAVGHKLTVIVDSGFRRGLDVVKALSLGAQSVMLGRAALYGLAAGGEDGVRRALSIFATDIDRVLGQLGCRSIAELGPHLIAGGKHSPH